MRDMDRHRGKATRRSGGNPATEPDVMGEKDRAPGAKGLSPAAWIPLVIGFAFVTTYVVVYL